MSIELLTILLFVSILVVFATGMPVGYGIGAVAMIFGAFLWGPRIFNIIPRTTIDVTTSFLLLAVPLFMFMGQVLLKSGLGEAMFRSMHVLAGPVRGGLAIGVIIVCSIMGAMVGIIGAGIMTAGAIALPSMLNRGYNKQIALGSVMAGGGMGILIPPSIPMIIFASVTNASIAKLFAGGIVPGLIMALAFMAYIGVRCALRPQDGPALPPEERGTVKEKLAASKEAAAAFFLIFLVLGSIIFGVATPTEAAALGALGGILVTILYGRFSWGMLKEASYKSAQLTGMCIWIVIGAMVFNNFHMMMGAVRLLNNLTSLMHLGPWQTIILMQLSLLLLGCIMDELVIVLICAALYTPIAVNLGFDPVWFGILMVLNLEIAIQTPPYGFALFFLKGVAPSNVTMLDIYKSITPFVVIKLLILGLCMAFPGIVLWLPNLLFGQ